MPKQKTAPLTINARITQFFLERSRVTLLFLFVLILLGIGSIFMLRTSGFPSPSIDIILVNTVYPGASSTSVLEQITKPLETEVKEIDGVKSVNSSSRDNVSSLVINLNPGADLNTVKGEVDSTLNSIVLPDGANRPSIFTPKVSGDDYYFALVPKEVGFRPAEIYQVFDRFRREVEEDPAVSAVNVANEIEKRITVKLSSDKLAQSGLTTQQVIDQLRSWGLSLPVAEAAEINDKEYNINLSLNGSTLEDLGKIQLVGAANGPTPRPIVVRLNEVATLSETYDLGSAPSVIGFEDRGEDIVTEGLSFSIDVSDEQSLADYDKRLEEVITQYFDPSSTTFKTLSSQEQLIFRQYELVSVYNVAKDNEEQVQEVISGMIGGPWNIPAGWIGYIFGGIQLVFLSMLLMVSWRAAIISALAIPLSFFFATIWLVITGNDLNTLVLFSLVLVIGLVVDPALVVLEAIQRKLDSGIKGKEAIVSAVNEIGWGLVLAVLTSLIVFFPFAVVSGVFGQIISYIPLTVLPAIIGSYIVPIVFLAWMGGIFLRRNANASDDEAANLWPIARGMVWLNKRILNLPGFVQVFIVIAILGLSIGIAGFYLGSGAVKTVQFAQPLDGNEITINATTFPQLTEFDEVENNRALLSEIMKEPTVAFVAPFESSSGGAVFLAHLVDRSERPNITASEVVESIEDRLSSVGDRFVDITVDILGAGPQNAAFPIALGIKNKDLAVQRQIALDVTALLNAVCKDGDNPMKVDKNCTSDNKIIERVDNGYGETVTRFIEIRLDREKLLAQGVQPLAVQSTVANLYSINNGKKVAVIKNNDTDLDVMLDTDTTAPVTIDDLKKVSFRTVTGGTTTLADLGEVTVVESPPTIRRVNGEVVGVVNAKPKAEYADQSNVAVIQSLVLESFNEDYKETYDEETVVEVYSEGDAASIGKSFQELGLALLLAILLTYVVLVVFFDSFSLPVVILFAIPLTFIGIFPALAYLGGGQLGFLEIIGVIILVGIVENVAIFLIDGANQKVREEGWSYKDAIAYASGVRFRPIMLTKITTLVSTLPLILFSELYRSLSLVIVAGLLTSGFMSLIISPILYVAFRSVSDRIHRWRS